MVEQIDLMLDSLTGIEGDGERANTELAGVEPPVDEELLDEELEESTPY